MKISDMIHLRGEVLIQTLSNDGKLSTVVDDKNLIVLNGRLTICNALANISTAAITDIAFGSGGTVSGNSNVPLSVLPSDTLLNKVLSATFSPDGITGDYTFSSSVESSPSPRIIYNTVILQNSPSLNTVNNNSINEIALMLNTPQPTAFAIKRFPTILKSNSISIIIQWVIYI